MRDKRSSGVPTRSDTNQSVQTQKQARSLKIRIEEDEGLYYPSSENKGAGQLCSYCEVDLRLCFRISKFRFSHYAAHLVSIETITFDLIAVFMTNSLFCYIDECGGKMVE